MTAVSAHDDATLAHCRMDTPIGALVLSATPDALVAIALPGAPAPVPVAAADSAVLRAARTQLAEYFAGTRRAFDLPLRLQGTAFQRAVWAQLCAISFGATVTYGELAAAVGRPSAVRAVGQANGANPIPIVVPCHRVIATGRRIGGYAGGPAAKQALLGLEGVHDLRVL